MVDQKTRTSGALCVRLVLGELHRKRRSCRLGWRPKRPGANLPFRSGDRTACAIKPSTKLLLELRVGSYRLAAMETNSQLRDYALKQRAKAGLVYSWGVRIPF